MSPSLPVELTDHIIDALWRDLETLELCSQVSKAWRPRSLSHLFSAVEVREDAQFAVNTYQWTRQLLPECIQMTLTRFKALLSRRSGRAMFTYVQHLLIRWNSIGEHDQQWPSLWHTVRFPRHQTVNVRTLRIVFGGGVGFDSQEWALFAATLARLVRACRTSLQKISGIGSSIATLAVLSSLIDCPELREVELSGVWQYYAEQVTEATPIPVPRLLQPLSRPIHLRVDQLDVASAVRWVQLNADVAKVDGITMTRTLNTLEPIVRYEMITSLKLLYLATKSVGTVPPCLPEISSVLANLPSLRVLVMPTHPYAQNPYVAASFIDGIASFSETLSHSSVSCPSLRTLVLLDCSYKWELPNEDSESGEDHGDHGDSSASVDVDYDWAALDFALAMPKWRGIQHVALSFTVRVTRDASPVQAYFDAHVRSKLVDFGARGGTIRVLCTAAYDYLTRNAFIDDYTRGITRY